MAKLFDDIFTSTGSGDVEILFTDGHCDERHGMSHDHELENHGLWCHTLILTQHPYFNKMLVGTPLREGRTREIRLSDDRDTFIEMLRFLYTNQIDITRINVASMLTLADKYCVDEVRDLCLKFVQQHFDADLFYGFADFISQNTLFQEKLKEQLISALRRRRNFCSITEDPRWCDLPIEFVEELLSQDDLPITDESEVLTLVAYWMGQCARPKDELLRLLATFRKCEDVRVSASELQPILRALGYDIFSELSPRGGGALWDPPFVIHRHEAAGNVPLSVAGSTTAAEFNKFNKGGAAGSVILSRHTLGPRDFLQQEPGWTQPGLHRLHVNIECQVWSHKERRLLRTSIENPVRGGSGSIQARRVLLEGDAPRLENPPLQHTRSTSPPMKFQVRMPPIEDSIFDIGQNSEGSDQERLMGAGVRRNFSQGNFSQDKIEHDSVDHNIICGVFSGHQRHGVRLSQHDRNAIYHVEDVNSKQFVEIGGTTKSVTFDLELTIGDASNCGISRCILAVMRDNHTLLEERFDVSARVPLRFYISSAYFDASTTYTVLPRWVQPPELSRTDGMPHSSSAGGFSGGPPTPRSGIW